MNISGIIICLLASMAGGYGVSYALNEAFGICDKLTQLPLSVKIKPWMIAAGTIALIVAAGIVMMLCSAPEISYYILSGILIGIMLKLLPAKEQ